MSKHVDIALLRSLAASGSFRTEIGERLGLHATTVADHAKKHGIYILYDSRIQDTTSAWWDERIDQALAMRDDGVPYPEIARRLGTTKNALVGKLFRLGKCKARTRNSASDFWLHNTDEMLRLVADGWSDRRIAKHLGIGHGAVHSRRLTLENQAAKAPRLQITFPPFGHCLMPAGDMPHMTFCGAPREDITKPYCAPCCKIAYLPPKPVDTRLAA